MKKERLFGIDLLRLIAVLAIVPFHIVEMFFYNDSNVSLRVGVLMEWVDPYSRVFAFSGFTVVIISFFLLGYKGVSPKKWKFLMKLCIFGTAVLLAINYEGELLLEWDIYCYVLISIFLIRFLSFYKKIFYIVSSFLLFSLFLPQEVFHISLGEGHWLYNVLVGDLKSHGAGSWPLIPWLGLALIPYCVGDFLRVNSLQNIEFLSLKEALIWSVLLSFSFFFLGGFYHTPIGPGFYQYTFSRPPMVFWSHIIWVIFIVRLSFLKRLNGYFNNNKYFLWISRLQLNQSFFLFYIVHLMILGTFSNFSEFFLKTGWAFDLLLLFIIPATEFVCVYLKKLRVKLI